MTSVLLFGIPAEKDARGSQADATDTYLRAVYAAQPPHQSVRMTMAEAHERYRAAWATPPSCPRARKPTRSRLRNGPAVNTILSAPAP